MLKKLIIILLSILTCSPVFSQEILDNELSRKKIAFGVEAIKRICPSFLWDSWQFQDIHYDQDSNTVIWVIQLYSKPRFLKNLSQEQVDKETEWIVGQVIKGYNSVVEEHSLTGDGDFMLYLSLGILLQNMESNGTNLRIALLKPIKDCLAFGDYPMALNQSQIKNLLQEKNLLEENFTYQSTSVEVTEEVQVVDEPEEVFLSIETKAEFPGGETALKNWIKQNLKYPKNAKKNKIEGTVIVEVWIERDGSISHSTVLNGVAEDLDAEALRLVKLMPNWLPGKNNGVPVRNKVNIPFEFKRK